jgi:hypothetical protein
VDKRTVLRLINEFQVAGDESVADDLLSPDFVDHGDGRGVIGRDETKRHFEMLRTTLAPFSIEVHDVIAEQDRVVTRKTLMGKQSLRCWGSRQAVRR